MPPAVDCRVPGVLGDEADLSTGGCRRRTARQRPGNGLDIPAWRTRRPVFAGVADRRGISGEEEGAHAPNVGAVI